jgi:type VI protein secretion system component Hcp
MTIAKWRCQIALGVVAALCAPIPLRAQSTPANLSSSVLTVAGLGCTTPAGSNMSQVNSWNWGESNTSSVTVGNGAGRTNFNAFVVTKSFDGCSPKLAMDSATGVHLPGVTLQQFDSHQNLLITVILSEAIVSDYQIGGSGAAATPSETVEFTFQKIQITDNANNAKFCYNASALGSC